MRVFLDTNILISAFISRGGQCAELLEHCASEHAVFTSRFVLEELAEKLAKKFKYPQSEVKDALRVVLTCATTVTEAPLPTPLCRDPDDDHVIAAAITAEANCIVTGDKDLLDLKKVHGIPVLTPSNFWKFEQFKAKD